MAQLDLRESGGKRQHAYTGIPGIRGMARTPDASPGGTERSTRRRLLHGLSVAGTASIAGCTNLASRFESEARFEVSDFDPPELELDQGETFDVEATITNTGGADGEQLVAYRFGETAPTTESLALAGGASERVRFEGIETAEFEYGVYDHGLSTEDDAATGTVWLLGPFRLEHVPEDRVTIDGPEGRVGEFMYPYDPDAHWETFKTFLHVVDPAIEAYLTAEPAQETGYDHHRGIFAGWGRIMVDLEMYDFWHSTAGERILHRTFADSIEEFGWTQTLVSEADWITGADQDALEEVREMTFHPPALESGIVHIDWTTRLTATGWDVSIWSDSAEHGGIHYRAHDDVWENQSATFSFPDDAFDGEPDPGQIRGRREIPWAVMACEMHDAEYYIQQLRHPDNPESEVWSAYRPYGRLGAFAEAELEEDETLTLRYGFLIGRGEPPSDDALSDNYEAFLERQ